MLIIYFYRHLAKQNQVLLDHTRTHTHTHFIIRKFTIEEKTQNDRNLFIILNFPQKL